MDRIAYNEINAYLISLMAILLLAGVIQAAAPVSAPESRFVWEPGENLTFTWTPENFDGFFYDPENRAGNETLTIRLNKKDRVMTDVVYSTTVGTATARYKPFGKHAVIGFMGKKYLAGYPEGKSDISDISGINPSRLHEILIDDDASYTLIKGGNLTLGQGYVLEIKDLNVTGAEVTLSLKKDGIETNTSTVDAGKNYIYEMQESQVIKVHIDSVFVGKETDSVTIRGIFQVSDYETPVKRDLFGFMEVTKLSGSGITMRNAVDAVDLKPDRNIEILNGIKLKVADSNTLRLHLYYDWYDEKRSHRGASGPNNITAWDGLNYAGFMYDFESGNYSESLVITNMTGRRIPEGGLTYTSYRLRKVPYAITNIKGIKPAGTDELYVTFSLGGNQYAVKSDGLARMLIAHGDTISEKKTLTVDEINFTGETWELGEGYALTAKAVELMSNPRKARLELRRNGVKLDDVWLSSGNAYRYFQPGETGTPKLITYLDTVFESASGRHLIMLRYTRFASDEIIQIKEGDRLGVFNITIVEPERIVLKNRVPIELKAGSSINLFGNLSFFVENSDGLRFYPTNMMGEQVMPEEVIENVAQETPDVTTPAGTSPVAGGSWRIPGFEGVHAITIVVAVYLSVRKI
ncbi:S-layer protein [uncultured archaeon]|nr:S-layer protein [uncultured archaeon]